MSSSARRVSKPIQTIYVCLNFLKVHVVSFSFLVSECPWEVLTSADSKLKMIMGATEQAVGQARASLLCFRTGRAGQGVSRSAQDLVENKNKAALVQSSNFSFS